jgi:hypothetical protein
MASGGTSPNNRLERSRGSSSFGGPRSGSVIELEQLRLPPAHFGVAQPHRYAPT